MLIATPDHWHVPLTVDACKAGKDVYVEKPLTHDLDEGKAVIAAQNENKRVVQVGTQQRSMTHIIKAYEVLKAGTIGKVHKVHCTWNRNADRARRYKDAMDPKTVDWKRFLGNAKEQEFDAYRFRQWRWFWDFGGGIFTDLMVHWIDVVHWFLDLDHPASAASIGDWYSAKDVWETPDTVQTLMRYPDKEVQVYFEGTFSSNRNGSMVEFMGTEGTLYIDRGRYEVIPDRGKKKPEPTSLILGTDQRRGSGLLRQAGRRTAAPDELGRVHPRPLEEGDLPGGSRRERRERRPPGEPVGPKRAGRGVEGVGRPVPLKRIMPKRDPRAG